MSQTTTGPLSFSINHIIGQAWQILKEKWAFLLGLFAAMIGIVAGSGFILGMISDAIGGGASIVAVLIVQVIGMIVSIGMMRAMIKIARNEKVDIKELFSGAKYLIQYFLAALVLTLIICFGYLLFIVPGVVWALKYLFTPFLVVDEGISFSAAMAKSAQMTNGIKFNLLGFYWMLVGVNVLGELSLLIGLVVTVPLSMLSMYVLYVELKKQFDSNNVAATAKA